MNDPAKTTKWQREYQAYQAMLPDLLKSHAGRYVAIHEGRVEDADSDELVLVERVLGRLGNVSIHVGLVAVTEPVIRIPHFREVKDEG